MLTYVHGTGHCFDIFYFEKIQRYYDGDTNKQLVVFCLRCKKTNQTRRISVYFSFEGLQGDCICKCILMIL